MEKEFVPYELAVKLKELGFDEPCLAFFTWKNELKPIKQLEDVFNSLKNSKVNTTYCSSVAPTFSQAFRWFREKYGLIGFILPFALLENNGLWCYEITDFSNNWDESSDIHSPEEAELECLKKLIEIVKTK